MKNLNIGSRSKGSQLPWHQNIKGGAGEGRQSLRENETLPQNPIAGDIEDEGKATLEGNLQHLHTDSDASPFSPLSEKPD